MLCKASQSPHPQARGVELVRWAARLGAVTAEALESPARQEQTSASRARAVASRAPSAGRRCSRQPSAERVRRRCFVADPRAGISAAGLCAASSSRRRVEPRRTPGHAVACAAAAAVLGSAYPTHVVPRASRELRRDERVYGAERLASAQRPGQGAAITPAAPGPDLAVLWPAGRRGVACRSPLRSS